jgi:ribosomal protein S18 acetylase RimI-like enzyme
MEIEVRKLSKDLLNDWLNYFDNEAFKDNKHWIGCYCMCYHWNKELQSKKSWDCQEKDIPYNRICAINFINEGKLQGYLAYIEGKVVGWVNTNDKTSYDSVNFTLPIEEHERNKKIKSIVCFNISPDYRGVGIASKLLDKICADAKNEGYDYIEAYPFIKNENNNYHGPQSLYEKFGFSNIGTISGCNIVRKYLK